jgi:hypothetical protein
MGEVNECRNRDLKYFHPSTCNSVEMMPELENAQNYMAYRSDRVLKVL